ncbi:hypothetical protein [Aliivibrio sp. SR45-2]|uniref:hypothetical protein n=1 Tax=Aliivibrio sp. SR45-2 TaxID=2760931 RepID=UPI0015FC75CD|nr:hypothetical protein [Aliivibrio sp. SR45-2]MBB1311929.1 hypothetical protein [Aliivibrio sp. SR45-2]
MMRCKLISLVVMLSVGSPLAFARVVDIELSIYGKGTMLANSPRERQSADYWHQLSNKIMASESKLGAQKMWQYAGLSEALAAIAANKRNDIKAYEYWSNSTRYLLTGGTEWSQMQKYLHRRYENINTQLSTQLTSSDVGISLDNEWQQELTILQIWEDKLGVFTFKGPKLGLKSNSSGDYSNGGGGAIATPNYNSTRAIKTSNGKKKLTGLGGSFSRGQSIIPVASEGEKSVLDDDTKIIEVEELSTSSEMSRSSGKNSDIVVITPDEEFDYRTVEKDNKDNELPVEEVTYHLIHKANIGNVDENTVEVLQRRTFIPVVNDEEPK